METFSEDNNQNGNIQWKYSMQGRKICKGEKYTRKKDIEEKLMLLQENDNEGNIAGNLVKG